MREQPEFKKLEESWNEEILKEAVEYRCEPMQDDKDDEEPDKPEF